MRTVAETPVLFDTQQKSGLRPSAKSSSTSSLPIRKFDRVTHRCDIIETGNDSYRLKKRNQSAPVRRAKGKALPKDP
ncbi:MAG: hypothetical protein ACR2HE_04685 [Casimicrobiaceae bacterium]